MKGFSPTSGSTAKLTNNIHLEHRGRGNPSGIVVDKGCRVYLSNIPLSRLESEGENVLRSELEAFGPIEAYRLFTDKSGRYVGSALCTYLNDADAALAVYMMNGKELEKDEILHASISKDHGVILLHQNAEKRRNFIRDRPKSFGVNTALSNESNIESRWVHDKYEQLEKGEDMDDILGFRPRPNRGRGRGYARGGDRRGRGRGGEQYKRFHQLTQEEVEKSFEEYTNKRNALLGKNHEETENVGNPISQTPLPLSDDNPTVNDAN